MNDPACRTRPAVEVYPLKTTRDEELSAWQEELYFRIGSPENSVNGSPFWVRRAIQWCLYVAGKKDKMPEV